jgi:hypothetical protein
MIRIRLYPRVFLHETHLLEAPYTSKEVLTQRIALEYHHLCIVQPIQIKEISSLIEEISSVTFWHHAPV